MIICEGPDGSGKTTLAKRIAEEFDMEYRRPPEGLLSSTHGPVGGGALVEWWRDELRRPNEDRLAGVYDRAVWISEPIYSSVRLRRPIMATDEIWRGIADLWAEDPLIIFCMTDEAGMLENSFAAGRPRLADIGDDQQRLRAYTFLYWAAFGVWQQASNHVIQWDYNRDHFSHVVHAVEGHRKVRV